MSDEAPGPGWTKGLDGKWFQADEPVAEVHPPTTNWSPPPAATRSAWDTPGGGEAEKRFYALQLMISAPVALLFSIFVMISGGPPGVLFGAMFALLIILIATRTSYLAVVGPGGSLTFKALIGTKETNVSRVSRVARRAGARAGMSWTFYFDDAKAQMPGSGGAALAQYVVSCNPGVDHP